MTASKCICVIYTGGTLGMVRSARGYVPAADLAGLLKDRMPQLRAEGIPRYEVVEIDPPIDSANVTPEFWYDLAARVRGLEGLYDGFAIIHGTDTLAYTASALSFLLAGMAKPVVLTGAQIPLVEIRSDAHANLEAALIVAARAATSEVTVVFGRRLLRANRAIKTDSTALDAFDSPSFPPLADLGSDIRFRDVGESLPAAPASWRECPAFRPSTLFVLPLFPGIQADMVEAVVGMGAQGVILECYGRGTAPDRNEPFIRALGEAIGGGAVVVAVSQCLDGNVALGAYAAGTALADCGVVSGFDLTREAAFTKMHTLFARGLPPREIAQQMQQNFRGELTPVPDTATPSVLGSIT